MWKIILVCLCLVFCLVICDLACDKYPIETDFGPQDCDNSKNLFYNLRLHRECIPGCQFINFHSFYICDPLPCPPGSYCTEEGRCEIDEESCLKYFSFDPAYQAARWKPECLLDGTWAPKQCKGNRCFCFDAIGNRIFGDAFLTQSQNMTCACSRKRVELEALGEHYFVSLHCDSVGNYEPLQCQSGSCWCVEPTTGEITAPAVPQKLIAYLPCYNMTTVGEQYLRQCESHLYAQERIRDEFTAHGTTRTNFGILRCQYDGSYGPFIVSRDIVSCVWRDNSNIASYATHISTGIANINCNCARDSMIFQLAGIQLIQTCLGSGNYDPVQRDGDQFYCVDSDGHRKSDFLSTVLTAEDCALLR